MKEIATELEFLKWFYMECDFGPSHGDEMARMEENFKDETGKELPDGYGEYSESEDDE